MRGERLYTIQVLTTDGKSYKIDFWSRQKKGSIENFCDGISKIYAAFKIEGKDIQSYEISYAQTSLNRR